MTNTQITVITVYYTLSPDGQKAALVAGLPSGREQTTQIPVSDTGLLSRSSVDSQGVPYLYLSNGWPGFSGHGFDLPIQAEAEVREALAARDAAEAQAKVDAEARAAKVLEARAAKALADREAAEAIASAVIATSTWDPRVSPDGASVNPAYAGQVSIDPGLSPRLVAVYEAHRTAQQARARRADAEASLAHPFELEEHRQVVEGRVSLLPAAPEGDSRWAKRLLGIDPKGQGGSAFLGDWLKLGLSALFELGEITVGGSSTESRRNPTVKRRTLYIATGYGLLPIEDNSSAEGLKLLAMSPSERVEDAVNFRITQMDAEILRIQGLDLTEWEDLQSQRDQILSDLRAAILKMKSQADDLSDIAGAALAIVKAGFRAMTKAHHPDTGGTDAEMSLINEAHRQLREMLRAVQG